MVTEEPDYASGPRDAPAEVVSVRLQTDELAPLTLAAVRWVTHTRLALLDRTPPDSGCRAPGHACAPRPTARKAPPAARRADGMPMLLQRQTRGVAFGNACGDDGGNDYDYGLVCVVDDSVATSTTTAPPDAASSIASTPSGS